MSSDNEDKKFTQSHLDSPEYRKRLMRKLNTLIAVLEVACSKVRRSLAGPEPDIERLGRIHKNLQDTLQVCVRAKQALERCEALPEDLPSSITGGLMPEDNIENADFVPRPPQGSEVEMTSRQEAKKFKGLGPIEKKDLTAVDLDDLCRQLME
ncbi:MAG: hypothetical protein ACI8QS_001824 [Planctomycetota bacterium]|jgi:hypothetical protein